MTTRPMLTIHDDVDRLADPYWVPSEVVPH